jgi:hypothetical protein
LNKLAGESLNLMSFDTRRSPCVGLLAAFVRRRFGVRLSGSSLRRILHRHGWRWARPRLAPMPRSDPEAEGKLAALAAAWNQVQAGQGQLLFVDESDLDLLPVLRAMWMKGPRPAPIGGTPSLGRWTLCAAPGSRPTRSVNAPGIS